MNRKIVLILTLMCIYVSGCQNPVTNQATGQKGSSNENVQSQNVKEVSKTITEEDALKKVSEITGTLPKGYHLAYDRLQTIDNKEYYVMHLYEAVIDNVQTGDSHTVTYKWYYVDKEVGDIYLMDLATDNLVKVQKEEGMYKE